MKLAGIKKLTLLDWPGRPACIVFTAGCGLRCKFCHNPEFVLPEKLAETEKDLISEEAFFRFLETRRGLLEGVVVCGGEPSLQPDLPEFCRKIKALGFPVKLDTNGQRPDVVKSLLDEKLVDYVAMDFKHAPGKYDELTGVPGAGKRALETARLVIATGVDHEFRTTAAAGIHTEQDVTELAGALRGAKRFFLQNFRTGVTLDPAFAGAPLSPDSLLRLRDAASAALGGATAVAVRA